MEITLEQKKETNKALVEVFNKCHENASFKEKLIDSPKETLEVIGANVEVEEGKRMVVEDQTNPNIIYLNIPAVPNLEGLELSEAQLEAVAGGGSNFCLLDGAISAGSSSNFQTGATSFTTSIKLSFGKKK